MTGVPPSVDGALQVKVAVFEDATAASALTAVGRPNGVTTTVAVSPSTPPEVTAATSIV